MAGRIAATFSRLRHSSPAELAAAVTRAICTTTSAASQRLPDGEETACNAGMTPAFHTSRSGMMAPMAATSNMAPALKANTRASRRM